MDFRKSTWEVLSQHPAPSGTKGWQMEIPLPVSKRNQAILAQIECGEMPDRLFLSTQVRLIQRIK
jgi:hypothetical protein